MKYTKFILAAFAALSLFSCAKENLSEKVVYSTEPVSFVASVPEFQGNKGYASDGKVTWETTDCIYITTDVANAYVESGNFTDANGVKIPLNSEGVTISPDGKTVSFTVTGLPAGATKYYAVAVDNVDGGMFYGTYTNGSVLSAIGKQAGFNKVHKRHMAVACCTPSNTTLHFSPAGAIVKFTNADGKIGKLVLSGNNSENVCQYYSINAETMAVTHNNHSYNKPSVSYNYTVTGDNYIFLAPGIEFTSGMLVTGYSDNDGTVSLGTYSTKTFTTEAGKMYDLGDIASKLEKTYTNYYDKWLDGKDIVIGNKTYNKSTFTGSVTHITENKSDVSVYEGAAYFVDPGLTVNFKGLGTSNSDIQVFVIGNTIGTRSDITLSGDPYANCMAYKVAFGNLNISYGSSQKLFRTYGNKNMGYLVMDNCQLNFMQSFVADGQLIEDLYIVDSDINMNNSSNDHMCAMIRQPGDGKTGNSIVLKNNVFYSSSFMKMHVVAKADLSTTAVTYGTVDIENNTFYKTYQQDGSHFLVGLAAVSTSGIIKDNLVYAPSSAAWDHAFACISAKGSAKEIFTVSGNKVNCYTQGSGYPFGRYVDYNSETIWIGQSDAYAEDPFVSFDTNTGKNTRKEAYSSVGATR